MIMISYRSIYSPYRVFYTKFEKSCEYSLLLNAGANSVSLTIEPSEALTIIKGIEKLPGYQKRIL